jgi:hypothetical protein
LRVNEIHGLAELPDTYELDQEATYVVIARERLSLESREFLRIHLRRMGITATVVDGLDAKLFEILPREKRNKKGVHKNGRAA